MDNAFWKLEPGDLFCSTVDSMSIAALFRSMDIESNTISFDVIKEEDFHPDMDAERTSHTSA